MKPSSSLDKSQFRPAQFQHKSTFLCLFCGGASCKHQDHTTNSKPPNAIPGLHSNWITDRIIASQRLSQRLITEHNLLPLLKSNHIQTILNVQQPGQHASCGDGIISTSGFSYYPERLYDAGIKFFNLGWQDMTSTNNEYLMKLVNVFALTFETNGKILVHCHAGKGRTIMAICAWLIYGEGYDAERAMGLAVQKREGVLTKGEQRQAMRGFEEYVKARRVSFGLKEKFNLERIVDFQQQAMLQTMKRKCQNTPYVHRQIIDEIVRRLNGKLTTPQTICKAITHIDNQIFEKWGESQQLEIKSLKSQLNKCNPATLPLIKDIRILTQTLFDFYQQLHFVSISLSQVQSMLQYQSRLTNPSPTSISSILAEPEVVHILGSSLISTLLSFAQFLRSLVPLKHDKQNTTTQPVILRIVKALHSKKKYQRCYYTQRQYNFSSELTQTEEFLVRLMVGLVSVDLGVTGGIRKEIRRLSADMHYHIQNYMKKQQVMTKTQMQELYLKCLR